MGHHGLTARIKRYTPWWFGRIAVEAAADALEQGGTALEAAVIGAWAVEDDPRVRSVGFGGLPDLTGRVTLDACVMDGAKLDCGAVAAVENVRHVADLAKRVMEKTKHICLAGQGAKEFAVREGFLLESLLTVEALQEWERDHPKHGANYHQGRRGAADPRFARHRDRISPRRRRQLGRGVFDLGTRAQTARPGGRFADYRGRLVRR